MVKAVAVLTGDKGVEGTAYFNQEGNGTVDALSVRKIVSNEGNLNLFSVCAYIFISFAGPTTVNGRITGLSFHVHALGDTTNGCNSTGSSFFLVPHVLF